MGRKALECSGVECGHRLGVERKIRAVTQLAGDVDEPGGFTAEVPDETRCAEAYCCREMLGVWADIRRWVCRAATPQAK